MTSTGRDRPAGAGQQSSPQAVPAWTTLLEAQVIDRMARNVRSLLEKAEQYWDGYDPDPDRYILCELQILADIRRAVEEAIRLIAERNMLGRTVHSPPPRQMARAAGADYSVLIGWALNPLTNLIGNGEGDDAGR